MPAKTDTPETDRAAMAWIEIGDTENDEAVSATFARLLERERNAEMGWRSEWADRAQKAESKCKIMIELLVPIVSALANLTDTDNWCGVARAQAAVAELTAAITLARQLAAQARADLETATPLLIGAIRHQSGQSHKLERILWSCWNDEHPVNLCDALAGLDANLAQAAVAMIAARAHCGGDADDMLRAIIDGSGSQISP